MKTKLSKLLLFIITALFSINLFTLTPTPVFAESDVCSMQGKVPEAVYNAAGCPKNGDQLPKTITNILYAIIGVSGLVAVIFVLIGGYNYMTSTGDGAKIEKAKKTILYACIGLAVCALAFVITNWAISVVNNNTSQSPDTSQEEKQSDSDNK